MRYSPIQFLALFTLTFVFATGAIADPEASQLLSTGHVNDVVTALTTRKDAQSLNLMSRAYYSMERWDEAVKYGEKAVNLDPQNASYHLWLGREYGRKAAASNPLSAAGLAKRAKNEFERAVQLDPGSIPAHVDLAQYYTEAPGFMGGGVDKARAQAAAIQQNDPGMAHLILARVDSKQKDYAGAETEYRAAITQARNPSDMWLQLASFYRERGRLEDMQNCVASALAVPHRPAESYFDAGNQLYLSSRNLTAAVDYLQKYLSSGQLVESAPAFRAHYLMGQLQEKMGNSGAATSEYQASLALASGFAPAQRALSHVQ